MRVPAGWGWNHSALCRAHRDIITKIGERSPGHGVGNSPSRFAGCYGMATRRALTLIAVVLGLGGLAVSVALAIDHLGPAPAFCAEGGCAAVRTSAWARPLGIPLPFFGMLFYAVTLALLAI